MGAVETGADFSVVRDQFGRWILALASASTDLPTSGVENNALAYIKADERFYTFDDSTGAWVGMATTVEDITVSDDLVVTDDASVGGDFSVTGATSLSGDLKQNAQLVTDDGAITAKGGVVGLNKAGAIAATLADPTTVTDDGKVLIIVAQTAQAHTVDNSAGSGFNGGGAGSDVGTFGGAIGDSLILVALGGVWHVVGNTNVTLA